MLFLLVLISFNSAAYAADINYCTDADAASVSGDAPPITAIFCPVIRVFNVLLFSVGVVFVVMIGYGAIKISMSLGEPKGLSGAKQTWTYAFFGGLVILFFYAVYRVIASVFGFPAGDPMNLITRMSNGLQKFLELPQ